VTRLHMPKPVMTVVTACRSPFHASPSSILAVMAPWPLA